MNSAPNDATLEATEVAGGSFGAFVGVATGGAVGESGGLLTGLAGEVGDDGGGVDA